jgi:hypothetical protein
LPALPPAPLLSLLELTQAQVKPAATAPKSPKLMTFRKNLLFCWFALDMT